MKRFLFLLALACALPLAAQDQTVRRASNGSSSSSGGTSADTVTNVARFVSTITSNGVWVFISALMTSVAFTDILCARSATVIVSGTVTSRTTGPDMPGISLPSSSRWRWSSHSRTRTPPA